IRSDLPQERARVAGLRRRSLPVDYGCRVCRRWQQRRRPAPAVRNVGDAARGCPVPARRRAIMKIGSFDVSERVLVVAEIGNNHEGSLDNARELVRQAAVSGADAVKFQTFNTRQFVSPSDAARFARLQSFELGLPQFAALAELARSLGVLFLSTPLD